MTGFQFITIGTERKTLATTTRTANKSSTNPLTTPQPLTLAQVGAWIGGCYPSSRFKGPDWYYAPILEPYLVDESGFPFLKIQLIVR